MSTGRGLCSGREMSTRREEALFCDQGGEWKPLIASSASEKQSASICRVLGGWQVLFLDEVRKKSI